MKRKAPFQKEEEEGLVDVAATFAKTPGDVGDEEVSPPITKVTKTDLYKPPTNEELHQLKETENLFHSTLFRMQITELLAEVRVKERRRQQMMTAVETVKKIISSIKKGKKHDLDDQSWLTSSEVKMPMVQNPVSVKGTFQYLPPVDVKVTGSFYSNTEVKGHSLPDIVVVMPKESFDPKDYLNQRYLRKRSLYLSKIAIAMTKRKDITDCLFSCHHGNHLKPKLTVTVTGDGKPISVNILAMAEEGTFKLNRFQVAKNNVRPQWFNKKTENKKDTEETGGPTPFYNSCILEDLVHPSLMQNLSRIHGNGTSVQEGIILLKVWLRQRDLDLGGGGFSGFHMTMYVLYLVSQRKLNFQMSSYQIFKNTLLKLSQSDWTVSGVSLCHDVTDPHRPKVSDFHQHSSVVFVDSTGYLNMCYAMNRSIFERVQHEALLAVKLLESRASDSFEKLFMKRLPFNLTFDQFFHLEPVSSLEATIVKCGLNDSHLDHAGALLPTCLPTILERLRQGLGPRVTLLQTRLEQPAQWSVTRDPPDVNSQSRLTIGLLLDPQHAPNILDRGPPADSPQAAEFREFWGNKSELRRFQDGGICEAVLWLQEDTWDQRQLVCGQVVKHILHRHAKISEDNIQYIGGQLDPLIQLPNVLQSGVQSYGTGEEMNQSVMGAYDSLCKILRNLRDLPLTINSIQGVAPCFRCAEVFPPLPCTFRHKGQPLCIDSVKFYQPSETNPAPPFVHSLKVVCLMEASGKWPEDVSALRRLKAALLIEVFGLLKDQHKLPMRLTSTHLDILKDNYVFRVELASLYEISLLRMVQTPGGLLQKKDTDKSLAMEKEIIILPKLTSTLYGLKQQFSAYSPTVRLAKRWVCSHLLGDHLDMMAIELIVAYIFISPAPYTAPRTSLVGFQRFLDLLRTFDWKLFPLMVNLNNEFTDADFAEIPAKFSKERSTLPLMFISIPMDKLSVHWTRRNPSAPILHRMVLLANKSASVLTQLVQEPSLNLDIKQIFRPSLDVFDVIIHLEQKQLSRQHEAVDVTKTMFIPRLTNSVDSSCFPVVDFDPVQFYLEELRSTFSELCLFFHDRHGGAVIGVVWKPHALEHKEFKVSQITGSKPIPGEGHNDATMTTNVAAILEDFQTLGNGLVREIEDQRTGSKQTEK